MTIVAAIFLVASRTALDPAAPSLLTSVTRFQPGKPFLAGVRLRMKPGWHVYWRNPGDAGQEIGLRWRLPRGWKVGEITWPLPQVLVESGIVTFAYRGETVLSAEITPASAASGTVKVDVTWLACKDICIPGSTSLALVLRSAKRPIRNEAAAALLESSASRSRSSYQPGHASAVLSDRSIVLTIHGESVARNSRFLPYDRAVLDYAQPATFSPVEQFFVANLALSPYFDPKRTSRLRGIISQYNRGTPMASGRSIEIDVPIQIENGKTL